MLSPEQEPMERKGSQDTDSDEDSKIEAIMSLRDLVVKQRVQLSGFQSKEKLYKSKIQHLSMTVQDFENQTEDTSSVCSGSTTRSRRFVSFGPSFERSDDLSGLTSVGESADEIYEAMSSIKEQASQVETAIALDELESVKLERERLKLQLESSRADVRDMMNELEECRQNMSTLELEKELAQAEATKYRENLQTCMQYIVEKAKQEEEPKISSARGKEASKSLANRSRGEPKTRHREDPKAQNVRNGARRLFSPVRFATKQKTAKPKPTKQPMEAIEFEKPKESSSVANKLLCLACMIQEQNKDGDTILETPIKLPHSTRRLVTPSPQEESARLCHSGRSDRHKAEIAELEIKLEQVQYQKAQKETTMLHQVYRLEQDIQDTAQGHQKQLQMKDGQISKLRKELSILSQQRHQSHMIHFEC